MEVYEEFEDVLYNIEYAIVTVYHHHPELTDSMVNSAAEGLVRTYTAEERGKQPPPLKLTELEREVFTQVQVVCEWCLGRTAIRTPIRKIEKTLILEEVILCLKQIRKSIRLWTTDYGKRGYLNYVKPFFPM